MRHAREGSESNPSGELHRDVSVVTFDFYNTLVCHETGEGRGHRLMTYLRSAGLDCDPWEHQVLYDVFQPHLTEYSPTQSDEAKQQYRVRFAGRVFRRLRVQAPAEAAAGHAEQLWQLLGPASLRVFPDVRPVLARLKSAGLKMAIISNWQCGLGHFCTELGISDAFAHVISSAEVGHAKPAPEIFAEACRRLGVAAHAVLHVGDSIVDDMEGGRRSGLQVMLIDRSQQHDEYAARLRTLAALPQLLGV
jgi:HAD superfamily hydrolase (TIGR01549 family)